MKHTPATDAWECFRESAQFANAKRWAALKNCVGGSLHIAFFAGWEAAYAQPLHKAAPDLLKACSMLLESIDMRATDIPEARLRYARAAIAKAKREEA